MEDLARYLAVCFEKNNSVKWDGKEAEVPGRTVVRLGWRGADGLERVEVHWPGKGKGKARVWRCAVLEAEVEEETPQQPKPPPQQPELPQKPKPPQQPEQPRQGPGVGKDDRLLGVIADKARARHWLESQSRKQHSPPSPAPAPKRQRGKGPGKIWQGEQQNFTCVYEYIHVHVLTPRAVPSSMWYLAL